MTRALPLACLIMLCTMAPAASAATAPARVAFSVASQVPHFGDGGGASGGVALPGGSVVTFAYDAPTQTSLALNLRRNGALYTPFGGGTAIPSKRQETPVAQNSFNGGLLRRDDGSGRLGLNAGLGVTG